DLVELPGHAFFVERPHQDILRVGVMGSRLANSALVPGEFLDEVRDGNPFRRVLSERTVSVGAIGLGVCGKRSEKQKGRKGQSSHSSRIARASMETETHVVRAKVDQELTPGARLSKVHSVVCEYPNAFRGL